MPIRTPHLTLGIVSNGHYAAKSAVRAELTHLFFVPAKSTAICVPKDQEQSWCSMRHNFSLLMLIVIVSVSQAITGEEVGAEEKKYAVAELVVGDEIHIYAIAQSALARDGLWNPREPMPYNCTQAISTAIQDIQNIAGPEHAIFMSAIEISMANSSEDRIYPVLIFRGGVRGGPPSSYFTYYYDMSGARIDPIIRNARDVDVHRLDDKSIRPLSEYSKNAAGNELAR